MLHDAHPARIALARAAIALLLAQALVVIPVALLPGASAQQQAQPQNRMSPAPRERVVIPFHGDPRVRSERPEGPVPRNLRIITDDEFPPLHFADPDGQPVGFSVDLMRAICERMAVACTIQVRRFDTLLQTLAEGQADIVAAAIPVTASLKSRFHVSRIYHRLPARFVGAAGFDRVRVEAGFTGVRVGVARDTAHAAYLAEHFPKAVATGAADLEAALQLLLRGEVDLVFGDGQAAALWLGGREGAGFRFVGGPFLGIRHFGEGIGFVLRPDEPNLKRAVDYALQGVWDDGTYARLFLRYFPVSAF
ncbi:MAG: transporter substrate-binding domain-containing protein [Hyphomicrobiales bacterium]|jgi:polar amino acid transport system substrate-binding protein|nr:transporter substrate-binding domain-containing protein [Hyphomicrobiales bacterium]